MVEYCRLMSTSRKATRMPEPVRYLSLTEFAARIGVTSLSKYRLPAPDAMIGGTRGWTAETIDAWQAARPGSGNFLPKVAPDHPHEWVEDPKGWRRCSVCAVRVA
jgi:predicted DNA-binding transcriptional regulator AlpA